MSSQDVRAASNPNSHPRVLSGLSRSLSREVRERVALNPATSPSLLFHLLDDDHPAVSSCATLSLLQRLSASTLRAIVEKRPDRLNSICEGCVAPAPLWMNSSGEFLVSDAEFNHLRAALGHADSFTTDSHLERFLEIEFLRPAPPSA